MSCLATLPRTAFHHISDNEVARIFWGRIPLANATSFIYFSKNSEYKNLLHAIKYKGQYHAAIEMGRLFGLELRDTPFATADLIHPVPLHKRKLKQRGYNQSEYFAQGLSAALNIPVHSSLVKRIAETPTQTRKARYERWENVKNAFTITNAEPLANKHVLLVDDVITTGATIEACAEALLSVSGLTLSVASLAYAKLQ
ncbi:MAG: ComF family protein [Bacteroidales bacterium]|nr:ComF family protein [Bacteroidales bacterium]